MDPPGLMQNREAPLRARKHTVADPPQRLWRQLQLDEFFAGRVDGAEAEVPWSRVAAVLAINRLCAPGSELAIEERWYPTIALDDLLHL